MIHRVETTATFAALLGVFALGMASGAAAALFSQSRRQSSEPLKPSAEEARHAPQPVVPTDAPPGREAPQAFPGANRAGSTAPILVCRPTPGTSAPGNGERSGESVLVPVRRAAVISQGDYYRQAAQEQVLSEFGLTHTESRVAMRVISTGTFPSMARELGFSETGLRKTASRVYRKTGVTGRQGLIDLVERGVGQFCHAMAFMPLGLD